MKLSFFALSIRVLGGVLATASVILCLPKDLAEGAKQSTPCPGLPSHEVRTPLVSGAVSAQSDGEGPEIVFTSTVSIKNAIWLRLKFDDVALSGDEGAGNASFLRITSLKDNAVQTLHASHVTQWRKTSAYFNGDTVRIEILAYPGTGDSHLTLSRTTAGDPSSEPETLCGSDDRVLSNDPRAARHVPEGCSSWLHDDLNHTFITAGHCGVSSADVQEFNVPLSTAGGSIVHPGPQDQYVVDPSSIQFTNGGLGNDYTYFACFANSTTGLTAFQAQGQCYVKAASAPVVSGQTLVITGYGVTSSPISPTWTQVQKTHSGPYTSLSGTVIQYRVDTTGGNSGSAVLNQATGTVIGIHTNGGCTTSGGANSGTAIQTSGLQNALNNPLGLCKSGRGAVSPPLFVAGDLNNSFGTLNSSSGLFGKVSEISALMQGLAYNRNVGVFYGSTNSGKLYGIDPTTGAATLLSTLSAPSTISGLGYDPTTNTLFGIAQATGQLYVVTPATGSCSAVGPPSGGTVGALDFDAVNSKIFGIDDSGGVSKLVQFNAVTGVKSIIGNLGAGIADCNGLAWNDRDGLLYTINAGNNQLLRINPATGVATVVGATGGMFGPSCGLAVQQQSIESIAPASYAVVGGYYNSGTLASLVTVDSDRFLILGDDNDPNPRLEVTSAQANSLSASQVQFRFTTSASRLDMIETGELWDWTANSGAGGWDSASKLSRGPSASDAEGVITVLANPARFFNANRVLKSRLSWVPVAETAAFDGWSARVNQVQWRVSP